MKCIAVMDEHNYNPSLNEIHRVAARGVIFINNKLVLVKNCFGEARLPGGGQEPGESIIETLVREVKEETGYNVILSSIREIGFIEEKRMSTKENMIWHQIDNYYICDALKVSNPHPQWTESEKNFGMQQVFYTLDEAIENNKHLLQKEGVRPENKRELFFFEYLKTIKV